MCTLQLHNVHKVIHDIKRPHRNKSQGCSFIYLKVIMKTNFRIMYAIAVLCAQDIVELRKSQEKKSTVKVLYIEMYY